MPTRSYYFPREFSHIEAILSEDESAFQDDKFRKFRELNIAPLFSGMDLAIVLGIGPGLLISILNKQERHYRRFPLEKGDGSVRMIASPKTYLKVIQWWILDNILNQLEVHSSAFGFIKNRSILDNAASHLGSRHFLNVDIKSFFDSVKEESVVDLFSDIGYSKKTSMILARICCLDGALPQGAPTSPAIGNQILKPLDVRLSDALVKNGYKYSRYADDITVSGRDRIETELLDTIRGEVETAGFELKHAKTRFAGPGDRTEVTGLVVRDFVQPPREWRKRTRAVLHRLSLKPILETREIDYLRGIIGYAKGFSDSHQMQKLGAQASDLIGKEKG